MARPLKQGLDYFPLDVNCDDTVKLIEAKFGTEGFGVLIKLWQIIYENGYYIKWTERELLLYKNRINVDIILINDIINECVKWGLFNEALFKKQILTSSGIQKRYVEAVKRRNEITIEKQLWLTDIPKQTDKFTVNVYNNPINDDINSIDSHISTQSKVKENRIENKRNKHIDYPKMLFDFYLTLGLMKHKSFTSAMRDAISKAMRDNKYTIEDCKLLLERHKMVVDITMSTQFPVKARGLDVFFGQKVYNAKHLICSEYEDGGKYYELYLNDKTQDTVEDNKSKPQRTNYGRDEE